jgi:hypothetical protein
MFVRFGRALGTPRATQKEKQEEDKARVQPMRRCIVSRLNLNLTTLKILDGTFVQLPAFKLSSLGIRKNYTSFDFVRGGTYFGVTLITYISRMNLQVFAKSNSQLCAMTMVLST